jgi:Tetratricopeptide repeat
MRRMHCKQEARYTEAEAVARRALAIREKTLGPEHPKTAESANSRLYRLSTERVDCWRPQTEGDRTAR